jgi:ABC-type oligopeptide transport system substrate-binding subunit
MKISIVPRHFIILLIVSVLALAGCQPQSAPTDSPQPEPTEASMPPTPDQTTDMPVAISADIRLDPALAQDSDSLLVSQYLYEGLVRLDESGNPQPSIAESWRVSDDQLDYIFTLRADAAFSDGTPITPDVIVDNFNRWFDPNSPLRGDGEYAAWKFVFLGFNGERDNDNRALSLVDGIQKVDGFTVLVHLNRPVPELLTYLADPAFAILSTDALASGNYGGQDSNIISSGPYIVSSWSDEGLTLSPNPNYWGQKPTVNLTFSWR